MPPEFFQDFRLCHTQAQLATALGVREDFLLRLTSPSRLVDYQVHKIPRRGRLHKGEFRIVFEAGPDEVKHFHKTLARRLEVYASKFDPTYPAAWSFGYIRKRSTKMNAAIHCGAKLLMKVDLQDFFPSLSENRVKAILLNLGLHESSASVIARILCIDGSLSLGLSASPLLANLACHQLDKKLAACASGSGAKYSRYADDISISGDVLPSRSEVVQFIQSEGFRVAEEKFRLTKSGQAHFVTGLSVSDPLQPHVPKWMKRKLRQELYFARKHGLDDHFRHRKERESSGLRRIDGMVRYVSYIEATAWQRLTSDWEQLLARDNEFPRQIPRFDRRTEDVWLTVDESSIEIGSETWIALGCAYTKDRKAIESCVNEVLSDYLSDSFSAGKKSEIRNEGLHFSAAHPELRSRFVHQLPALPFRMYVVLARSDPALSYAEQYLRCLKSLTAHLLFACDRQRVSIHIEQNNKVPRTEIEGLMDRLFLLAEKAGWPRPIRPPDLTFVTKKEALVAVPDFMLGTLNTFVTSPKEDSGVALLRFERLRDRFSMIFDMTNDKRYRRGKPFQRNSLQESA